jgi:hypothetical protein
LRPATGTPSSRPTASISARPPLRDPRGQPAGHLFGYEGSPSGVFVVVNSPGGSGTYTVEVTTHDGRRLPLGTLTVTVTDGEGSFGRTLPVALRDIAHLRLVNRDGETRFQAAFRRPSR